MILCRLIDHLSQHAVGPLGALVLYAVGVWGLLAVSLVSDRERIWAE